MRRIAYAVAICGRKPVIEPDVIFTLDMLYNELTVRYHVVIINDVRKFLFRRTKHSSEAYALLER